MEKNEKFLLKSSRVRICRIARSIVSNHSCVSRIVAKYAVPSGYVRACILLPDRVTPHKSAFEERGWYGCVRFDYYRLVKHVISCHALFSWASVIYIIHCFALSSIRVYNEIARISVDDKSHSVRCWFEKWAEKRFSKATLERIFRV